jgi:hypothetical protein
MKKLALAMTAAAALAFTAPAFAQSAPTPDRMQLAQADVKVKPKMRDGNVVRKKVVIRHDRGRHLGWRHDRGRHLGWSHSRHHGAMKTVTVKHGGHGKTVIKKKTVIR